MSRAGPRWLVPEQVQTSAMDCGPAALTALLAAHGITASYGRLREACQTSVDGTSIDVIEDVANRLGLDADQVMLPIDMLERAAAHALPCLIVTLLPSGATHFVVVWNRIGPWVQVMDPASGRVWRRWSEFRREIYQHRMVVPATIWHAWASSDEAHAIWHEACRDAGIATERATALIERARATRDWYPLAVLDAALRLTLALIRADGLSPGRDAERFVGGCLDSLDDEAQSNVDIIPRSYWFARPAPPLDGEAAVVVGGAVLLRVHGAREERPALEELPEALAAALREPPAHPERLIAQVLGRNGWFALLALLLASSVAAVAVSAEALLLQTLLRLPSQWSNGDITVQLALAGGAFLAVLALLTLLNHALARIIGRRIEVRLRIALLEKIARLGSQYFHSRLVSDMAGRAHGLASLRNLPHVAVSIVTTVLQLVFTALGLIWISPDSAGFMVAIVGIFTALAFLVVPIVGEADRSVGNHEGALRQLVLDVLVGLTPLRLHRAQRAIQREYEQRLVAWWHADAGLSRLAAVLQVVSGVLFSLAAVYQVDAYLQRGGEQHRVLLLLFWTVNLLALTSSLVGLLQQYPRLRNRVASLLEPLGAPDEIDADMQHGQAGAPSELSPQPPSGGVAISYQDVTIAAGGHTILEGLSLQIEPGEHVAIVGPSGAGKSSLVGVVLGWHAPGSGRCLVDGQPLDGMRTRALRRQIAWLDPAVQLWNRSLLANLGYGRTAGAIAPDLLADAVLYGVVERLPHGLQTDLGEGGGLVSGGEGQRVRLGRILNHPAPRLVILDEPFRGLDRGLRAALLARVRTRWPGSTLLCITHDVAETRQFPRVLVIEGGRLVEDGAPDALLNQPDSRYAAMLAAEQRVATEGWASRAWRRVTIRDGMVEPHAASNNE